MRHLRLRTLVIGIALIGVILALSRSVIHRNKADWCRGLAHDYAHRAAVCLEYAADPAMSADDAQSYRIQADRFRRIADRYEVVADRPWLPYPRYPLLPEFADPAMPP